MGRRSSILCTPCLEKRMLGGHAENAYSYLLAPYEHLTTVLGARLMRPDSIPDFDYIDASPPLEFAPPTLSWRHLILRTRITIPST
jgi:hypothetical protein